MDTARLDETPYSQLPRHETYGKHPRRTLFDPANDGPEVEIILRERKFAEEERNAKSR